jgi:HEAT repeat protein
VVIAFFFLGAALAGAGRGSAEALPEDPVEPFRRLLKEEKGLRTEGALAFRRARLEKAARQIRSLGDISRALLLVEWPVVERIPSIDKAEQDARDIEVQVREELTARFEQGVRKVMRSGSQGQLVAVSNLVGETVVGAAALGDKRLSLYQKLADLAPDLAELTKPPRPEVRFAAARALGYFPSKPKEAVPALRALLDPDRVDPATRAEAATALGTLVVVVSGRESRARPSEPGVSAVESRPRNLVFDVNEEIDVFNLVVPAAAQGLKDPVAAVREQSLGALRQVTYHLLSRIPNVEDRPEYVNIGNLNVPDFPRRGQPPGTWTKRELDALREGHAVIQERNQQLRPGMLAFARNAGALAEATRDPDVNVRIQAQRVIEDLGFLRRRLELLNKFLPELPRDVAPKKDVAARAGGQEAQPYPLPGPTPAPAASLGAPVKMAPALLVKDLDATRGTLTPAGLAARRQETTVESENMNALRDVIRRARLALILEGLSDRYPRARLGALDALEAMGQEALIPETIPGLIRALSDPNLFVRWAAARILGELAPAGAAQAVPALARLLCDPDLNVRLAVAYALYNYGPAAAGAVSALGEAVGRGDAEFRIAAMQALEGIGTASTPALPAVIRNMTDIDPRIRTEAARVLGRFGPLAEGAAPALRRALNDPDAEVRRAVSEALLEILRR